MPARIRLVPWRWGGHGFQIILHGVPIDVGGEIELAVRLNEADMAFALWDSLQSLFPAASVRSPKCVILSVAGSYEYICAPVSIFSAQST